MLILGYSADSPSLDWLSILESKGGPEVNNLEGVGLAVVHDVLRLEVPE